jgi:hypothetical protein
MAPTAELSLTYYRTLWKIHIKIFFSGTSCSIGTFQQSLVEIGSVGSDLEEKIFFKFHPFFFLFLAWWPSWLEVGITGHNFGRGPSKDHSTKVLLQNFAEMILGWCSSKFVSGISELRPRWPPQPNLA